MKTPLYEGKAKQIFETEDPDTFLAYFKDDATAFNGEKKGSISDKGVVNASMSAIIFEVLEKKGIPTHFLSLQSQRELLIKKVEIILIEVVVRNIAAGSLCKRLGFEQGMKLNPPLVEWFYKNDDFGDPLITDDHVRLLGLADPETLVLLKEQALKINTILVETFEKAGLNLVDFKLEFGRLPNGEIVLADEISPDTCRLWDMETGKSLDKDRFRFDMGDVESAYSEVMKRMGAIA